MEAVTVNLDHQTVVAPEEIHDEGVDRYVHLRRPDSVPAAESQEQVLELAAGEVSLEPPEVESEGLRHADRTAQLGGSG
jgi:hypothetical protein